MAKTPASAAASVKHFQGVIVSSPAEQFSHPCTFAPAGRCSRSFCEAAMLTNPGVTERLAQFVVETRWNDLPQAVTHQAKRALMNFFAVALTGCRNATIETALQSLAMF